MRGRGWNLWGGVPMADDMGEKTELPSERKLFEARERGQVPKSTDLAGALELIVVVLLLVVFGGGVLRALAEVMRRCLVGGADALTLPTLALMGREVIVPIVIAMAPILGLIVIGAFVAQVGQFGLLFTTQPLTPKFDRLDPVKGLSNTFGRKNMVKTGLNVLKLGVIGWVGYSYLSGAIDQVATLPALSVVSGFHAVGVLALKLAVWLLVVLLLIGVADYLFQRWQHTQELKMTRQEVQDERRSMEGDPAVKGRRMQMMRKIAMQQINQAVPKADVIVTNPTHYSVAIQYDTDTMKAPRVVAKGADFLAMRIRQVAITHGVPIVERPPLARGLYAGVEVGQEIRPEFYQAVAEVLAYVYRLEREAAA
jgi:flagellar biosynthesis protein FlhB